MRLLSFVVVALVLTVAASAPAGDAVKDEMKKLEGTWVVQSFSEKGKVNEEMKGTELTFAGANLTLKMKKGDEQKEMKATYKIDPTKKPKTIDFTPTEGEGKGKEFLGIYELGAKTRKMCFAPAGKERPTEFSSMSDSGHILVTFEREKGTRRTNDPEER